MAEFSRLPNIATGVLPTGGLRAGLGPGNDADSAGPRDDRLLSKCLEKGTRAGGL